MVELNSDRLSLETLRNVCLQKHGLVSQDIRRVIWPLLMNVYKINSTDEPLSDNISWNN